MRFPCRPQNDSPLAQNKMAWFGTGLRALVYLKRISDSLERIAAFTDAQMPQVPKLSRRTATPAGEIYKPSVKDWNARYREENPGYNPDEEVEP